MGVLKWLEKEEREKFSQTKEKEKKAFYFFPDWKEVIKSGMSGKKSENGSKTSLSDV